MLVNCMSNHHVRWCTKGDVLCNTYKLSNMLLKLEYDNHLHDKHFPSAYRGYTAIGRPRKATLLILAGIYKVTLYEAKI